MRLVVCRGGTFQALSVIYKTCSETNWKDKYFSQVDFEGREINFECKNGRYVQVN